MEDSGAGKRNDPLPQTHQEPSNFKAALEDELARIQLTLASNAVDSAHDRSSLHFAAANLLDRLDRYDEAFAQARLAHQDRQVQYDPRHIEQLVDEKIELFTPQNLQCFARASESSDKPVFIVGMPQSGTSLVEQVLASHPMVHDAGELNWIGQIEYSWLQRSSEKQRRTLDLRRCSLAVVDELAARYLRPLIALNPQAHRITNAMPLNFLNVGLISRLFPEARVIHCVRDPLDTCLSCYLTPLGVGYQFTADLTALCHFYIQYRRLMDHWKQVLDHPILDVSYEAMVEDLEPHTQRILAFLDLPWDLRCHVQVRPSPERTSPGRWKHYRSHLQPLLSVLNIPANDLL